MKRILLSNGSDFALILDEDYIWASGFNWWCNNSGYIYVKINNKNISLHSLIVKRARINCPNEIDHTDGNPLNNQRKNLRAVTHSQNLMNSHKTSEHRGVFWDKNREKWMAQIVVNNKQIFLGRYDRIEQATFAYKIASKKYHGEFAHAST